jgi:hypothetical protein
VSSLSFSTDFASLRSTPFSIDMYLLYQGATYPVVKEMGYSWNGSYWNTSIPLKTTFSAENTSSVPIPGAGWLFSSGVFFLCAVRRRR